MLSSEQLYVYASNICFVYFKRFFNNFFRRYLNKIIIKCKRAFFIYLKPALKRFIPQQLFEFVCNNKISLLFFYIFISPLESVYRPVRLIPSESYLMRRSPPPIRSM